MLDAEIGQAILYGREINGRGRGRLWMWGKNIGDRGADVSVEQGQNTLHKGQHMAQGAQGAFHAGRLTCGPSRYVGQRSGGRRSSGVAQGIALKRGLLGWRYRPSGKEGPDDAQVLLAGGWRQRTRSRCLRAGSWRLPAWLVRYCFD